MRNDSKYTHAYANDPYGIADSYRRTEALRQRTFLDGLLYLDEQAELIISRFLPPKHLPSRLFRTRIKVNSAGMSPIVTPGTGTDFHTTDMKYQDYRAKRMKDGFMITDFDEEFAELGDTTGILMKEMHDRMNLREEYVGLEALMGNTWNNEPTHRLIRGWALRWNDNNSTPIDDILHAKLMTKLMTGRSVKYMLLNPRDASYLQSHPTILQQMQYTRSDLLSVGDVPTIKGVQALEVATFYKQAADEATMEGAPARGEFEESLFDETIPGPDNKRWLLENTAIFLTGKVGNMYTRPTRGNNWLDEDHNTAMFNSWRDLCPVVKDYADIVVLTFVDDDSISGNTVTVDDTEYPLWGT
jgi:hypothetical protein